MPVYEYECEHCGARFERIQTIKDEPIRQCPECSGSVHKVFHPAGIIFKGSGWYITDSRKSNSGAVTADAKAPVDSKEEKKTPTAEANAKANAEIKSDKGESK